jgi:hypothetical protein
MKFAVRLSPLACLLALGACGGESAPSTPPSGAASPEVQRFVLNADPGAALSVKAAKAAGAGDKVIVEGRIADVVKGFAAFQVMDTSLPYCGETNPEDHCKTPWDYCCESAPTRKANSLHVEIRGDGGRPLATPALPGVRLLDLVKVTGKLQVDEHGNQVLLADGVFRAARPEVPNDLEWPQ